MTLRAREFKKEDLFNIDVQPEQAEELGAKEQSLFSSDYALTIVDDKDIIAIIFRKNIDGMDCIGAAVSNIAGKHMLALVRMLKRMKDVCLTAKPYFLVKRDFEQAHRLAKIMGFKKVSSQKLSVGIYDTYVEDDLWRY